MWIVNRSLLGPWEPKTDLTNWKIIRVSFHALRFCFRSSSNCMLTISKGVNNLIGYQNGSELQFNYNLILIRIRKLISELSYFIDIKLWSTPVHCAIKCNYRKSVCKFHVCRGNWKFPSSSTLNTVLFPLSIWIVIMGLLLCNSQQQTVI